MKRLLTFTLLAIIALPLFAGKEQREVRPYDKNSLRMGTMVYALPKTVIQIDINAACTISKPGPFAQYAERYLASSTAIQSESRVWNFESADISELFIVDSTRMFSVSGEDAPVEFSEGKMLLKSVGWDVENNNHPNKAHHKDCKHHHQEPDVDTVFHMELLGEESLTSTSIPKMAERAAKQIFALREARMAILTCDVNHQPDGAATREILERIDRDERELTALFLGKKATIHNSRIFYVNPAEAKNNLIVARVSTLEGIASADDMIGTPVYVTIKPKYVTAPQENKKERKAKKGYYYIVPGYVKITISHNQDYTLSRSFDIPQNGYATWLSPSVTHILFNKNGTIQKMK